jgi:hypothetical protein
MTAPLNGMSDPFRAALLAPPSAVVSHRAVPRRVRGPVGIDCIRLLCAKLRAELLYRIDWFDPCSLRLSAALSNPHPSGII